jgi:hypothetical protein
MKQEMALLVQQTEVVVAEDVEILLIVLVNLLVLVAQAL